MKKYVLKVANMAVVKTAIRQMDPNAVFDAVPSRSVLWVTTSLSLDTLAELSGVVEALPSQV